FPALMDQQKFVEAEELVDRALVLVNKLAPPAQAAGPPPSLQRKRQCLEVQVHKWEQEGKDLQPIGQIMQDFQPLVAQQKFAEAEALVDSALKLLDGSAQPNKNPESDEGNWIAFGGRDADGRQQIFVVKPDGAGKKRLTQEGKQNFFPAWSRDGKRLAFTS